MKYQKIERKTRWRVIWESNLFTVILILVLFFSLFKMVREIKVRSDINKEIASLQAQRQKLEGQKADLEELLSYLQTDNYIEKEARLKLNLSMPGEKQINLSGEQPPPPDEAAEYRSNAAKWFDYFFK